MKISSADTLLASGVHCSSIERLVPYTERQMAQLSISSQQPGDSTSASTFGHAA